MVCQLLATMKTHKTPVAARLVHSSTSSIFNGIGGILNALLSPKVRALSHLCLSSEDVATRLRGIRAERRSVFLKFDVKDFYLAGQHDFIAREVATRLEDRNWRRFVQAALELVLTNQFV
jgi:hypothetical protein